MNYIESKLKKANQKQAIYTPIVDRNSPETKKIIKLIENKSTKKVKITELKFKNNSIKFSDKQRTEFLKGFTFLFEKEDFFDLVITFDIFFDKKEIRLVYKTFFYWKKTDTYYSNINLSCEYLEFIKKSIKKIKNVLKKTEEGKEYVDNYYNYRKYTAMKNLSEEIIIRKNSYQTDKFNKVFTRRMSLKEFKEILDKNDEVSIFLPLIDYDNKKIRFHEKPLRKKYFKKLLKNKEYKKLALIVKSFLNGGFFINDDFVSTKEELEEVIKTTELNKYLKHGIFSTYKYNEELDLYLNQCLIQKF
tara:strand:- start:17 stop:925 length:909 start_codon:yes stop_codon:yes gene_type:complete